MVPCPLGTVEQRPHVKHLDPQLTHETFSKKFNHSDLMHPEKTVLVLRSTAKLVFIIVGNGVNFASKSAQSH